MIKLFESSTMDFTTNGLGYLSDAIKCEVVEERNGEFELTLEYPITGIHFEEVELRRLIVCKSNPFGDPQAFRIYDISKPINGVVTIMACHISYDLSGIPVGVFGSSTRTCGEAFEAINNHIISGVPMPFTFSTTKNNSAEFKIETPVSAKSILGGMEGSILDIYGTGEYEFDNFNVKFHANRGEDRGVNISYGKNLTDIKQEENCANLYTGVYGYWSGIVYDDEGNQSDTVLVETSPKIINVDGTFDFTNILILDLTSYFEDVPSSSNLKSAVQNYITNNNIGVPKVSLDVSFLQLERAQEYETLQLLSRVYLCDTVTVTFPKLGINSKAKCIKTTYNAITDKYTSLELGEARSNLSSTIAGIDNDVNGNYIAFVRGLSKNSSFLQTVITTMTDSIKSGLGGYVVLRDSSGGTTPDELLIMDTDDIATATKVWRWNLNGLGYSNHGYEGPFELAMNMEGVFNANFITAGTMYANRIKGGTLTLGGIDNVNGTCLLINSSNDIISELDETGVSIYKGHIVIGGIYYDKVLDEDGNQKEDEEGNLIYGDQNGLIEIVDDGRLLIKENSYILLSENGSLNDNKYIKINDRRIELASYYSDSDKKISINSAAISMYSNSDGVNSHTGIYAGEIVVDSYNADDGPRFCFDSRSSISPLNGIIMESGGSYRQHLNKSYIEDGYLTDMVIPNSAWGGEQLNGGNYIHGAINSNGMYHHSFYLIDYPSEDSYTTLDDGIGLRIPIKAAIYGAEVVTSKPTNMKDGVIYYVV